MGRALVSQLLRALEKLEWSGKPEATLAGSLVFRTAVDQVDGYRGDPRVLGAALRTVRTGESLPYNFAGVAYILLAAAGPESHGLQMAAEQGAYDQAGLDAALQWLEKAQELAPDEVDINVIEALIYIYGGREGDARLVLDYLKQEAPEDYFLLRAEMTYRQHVGDFEQALAWNERALQQAETVPQRLRLKTVAGAIHHQAGDTAAALQAFTEALHFDDNNAWLCHQISLLHYELAAYEDAARYNEKALKAEPDFSEAQQMKEQLAEQQRSSGFLGRLFG